MKQILCFAAAFGALVNANAQGVKIGTPGSPNSSSILELESSSQGFLPPRMTTAERDAISAGNSETGLQIFNTTTNCVEVYIPPAWQPVFCGCITPDAPIANSAIGISCSGFVANWNASSGASTYFLDVATDAGFSDFVPGYQNLNVGNVQTSFVSGLVSGSTYYFRVRGASSCGTGINSSPVSVSTTSIPSAPGIISGLTSVCPNAVGEVYSISPVAGATSYNWTVPSGASITANNGTSITVTFGSNPTGNITVAATNCGSSAATLLAITQYSVCSPMVFNPSGTGATGSIQTFTVPAGVTSLTIDAYGAQGGNSNSPYPGGKGARMKGTFSVTPGQVLNVLVGQQPENLPYPYRGGGGGTFVYNTNTSTLLIAAGGGSGANSGNAGQDASITTTGGTGCSGTGGSGGNGGTSVTGSPGGGGYLTNGGMSSCSSNTGYGRSYLNGGAGGVTNPSSYVETFGGYGGGGQSEPYCTGGPGAGGGYSGGGGCNSTTLGKVAGGGGSYNGGTDQTNTAGAQTGSGQVIFTW